MVQEVRLNGPTHPYHNNANIESLVLCTTTSIKVSKDQFSFKIFLSYIFPKFVGQCETFSTDKDDFVIYWEFILCNKNIYHMQCTQEVVS